MHVSDQITTDTLVFVGVYSGCIHLWLRTCCASAVISSHLCVCGGGGLMPPDCDPCITLLSQTTITITSLIIGGI